MEAKRFSVYYNGSICGVFDKEEDARQYISDRLWLYSGLATIWDNQVRDYIYTEITI